MLQGTIDTYGRNGKLDVGTLESWLWDAACKIRGEVYSWRSFSSVSMDSPDGDRSEI